MVKRILYLLIFLVIFNIVEHFAHKKTDGFSLRRIQFETRQTSPYQHVMSAQAQEALRQPFHYLDCGNQCYAFVSDDGHYVLKLFKYARPPIPRFLTHIPLLCRFKPFRPHRYEKILWKQERDLQSYKLAWDTFRNETGLLAIHLDHNQEGYPTITLFDKIQCKHTLDLNSAPFILQRRAEPIYKQLLKWVAEGKVDEARLGIKSLHMLLRKRIAMDLQDDDVHFYSNFGFIGNEAIQIDPGHYTQGISPDPEQEMKAASQELIAWCEKHAPMLIAKERHE